MKISLGMIVRNEGRTLEACLASVAPFVDEIIIGLAGESTDNTEEIARKFTNNVFPIEWVGDFSVARNQVLEKCTGDYFLWLDGDDELIGGEKLRGYAERHPNVGAFYLGYDYGRDEQGQNVCFLIRERLVRMDIGWKWIGRVHEVLVPNEPPVGLKITDMLVKHHKPSDKHGPARNMDILLKQLEETEPNPDPRLLVYLGSEYAGRGNFEQAVLFWQRFIKLSGWDEEKYQTTVKISAVYRSLGKLDKALKYAQDAIAILPDWPDAYISLAKTYASDPLNNWKTALEYIKMAVSKPKPDTMLIINPLEYTYEPSLMIALCYTQLGDLEMALANYEQAYSLKPEPAVGLQIKMIRDELNKQATVKAFLALREHLGRHDEWLKVRKLYDVVPKLLEQHPAIQETWHRSMAQTAHILDPQVMVDFYTGNPHWAPMDDDRILDPSWLDYPRLAYGISTANRIGARTVVDWGCSDGFIALPIAKETGARVTGFDLDPRCVDLATVRAKKWGLDARFEVGNIEEIGGWEGEKADLAIFFEVIEHVIDPGKTLDRLETTAKHIALTTPYLAWESGELPAWDKLEPKGHLRIFDTYDIEALLAPRGRIHNLYKEPWGSTGWIFADYRPGETTDKTIIIGAGGTLEEWGPRKLASGGLGGSETAVIKLSESFAKAGHRPIVYNNIDSPGYYNSVCYRPMEHFRPEIKSDLFIAWRWPEAADHDINTDHLALWMHDTDAGDRLTPARAKKFEKIFVLTNWHKKFMQEKYPFIPAKKFVVVGNGVDLSRFEEPVHKMPTKVIYSSSPDRGLDIILEHIWPKVIEAVPNAQLHVYYGWNSFDRFAALPDWAPLREFKSKIERLMLDSKNVVQHGRIPQDRLAMEMQEATVWLYPTYFTETYCITAVEAQLAGAIPVTNHLAGLEETVKSGIVFENANVHDPAVQAGYAEAVIKLLQMSPEERFPIHAKVRANAPAKSWDQVAASWLKTFFNQKGVN